MAKCNKTLAGYEGVIGWGTETVCGVPDNSTMLNKLKNFGVITDFTPDGFWSERIKRRGIGSQGITQNRRTNVVGTFSIEYVPIDSNLDERLFKAFGDVGAFQNRLDTWFLEVALDRATPAEQRIRWLYNMCKVASMEIKLTVDEPITITENCVAQYARVSDNKTYPDVVDETGETIFEEVTIGADPDDISEEMLMYYDGEPILIPELAPPIILQGVSDMTVLIERNTEGRRGIRKGLKGRMPYEMAEGIRDVTLEMTKDFHDRAEYDRLVAEVDFDFHIEVGNWLIKLIGGNWEATIPPITEEDFVAETLTAHFRDAEYEPMVA